MQLEISDWNHYLFPAIDSYRSTVGKVAQHVSAASIPAVCEVFALRFGCTVFTPILYFCVFIFLSCSAIY